MIGLLENLIGADARVLHDAETLFVERGGIDVDAANLAIALLGGIGLAHGVGNEFGRIFGAFTVNQDETLMTQIFQRFHFAHEFLI